MTRFKAWLWMLNWGMWASLTYEHPVFWRGVLAGWAFGMARYWWQMMWLMDDINQKKKELGNGNVAQ